MLKLVFVRGITTKPTRPPQRPTVPVGPTGLVISQVSYAKDPPEAREEALCDRHASHDKRLSKYYALDKRQPPTYTYIGCVNENCKSTYGRTVTGYWETYEICHKKLWLTAFYVISVSEYYSQKKKCAKSEPHVQVFSKKLKRSLYAALRIGDGLFAPGLIRFYNKSRKTMHTGKMLKQWQLNDVYNYCKNSKISKPYLLLKVNCSDKGFYQAPGFWEVHRLCNCKVVIHAFALVIRDQGRKPFENYIQQMCVNPNRPNEYPIPKIVEALERHSPDVMMFNPFNNMNPKKKEVYQKYVTFRGEDFYYLPSRFMYSKNPGQKFYELTKSTPLKSLYKVLC